MKSLIPIFLILMIAMSSYPQNQNPVAVRDTSSTLAEVILTVDVLNNDYDNFRLNKWYKKSWKEVFNISVLLK